MGSESRLISNIHSEFVHCKRQIDKLWSDIDGICVDVLKEAVSLCFSSTVESNEDTDKLEKTLATKRKSNATLLAIESVKDEICKASPVKKPKLSLHSRRCEHSPHNQRSKRRIEKTCTVVPGSRPTDKGTIKNSPSKDDNDALKPHSSNQEKIAPSISTETTSTQCSVTGYLPMHMPSESLRSPQVDKAMEAPNKTFDITKSAVRVGRLSSEVAAEGPSQPAYAAAPVTSPSVRLTKGVTLSQASRSPSVDTTSVVSRSTDSIKDSVAVPDGGNDIPKQFDSLKVASKAPCISIVSVDLKLTPSQADSSNQDKPLIFNQSQTECVSGKTVQSSIKAERYMLASKMGSFLSEERLGGVSRLTNLSTSACSTHSATLSRTSHKDRKHSTLNNSKSGTIHQTERSKSVLAMKEQLFAEKQRIFQERLKENAERIRAFQEAKQREREAQKRANEERRLAVKNKAQHIAEMQRVIAENKQQIQKTRAEAEGVKQRTNTGTKPGCISRINEKENHPVSTYQKPVMARTTPSQSLHPKLTPNAPQAMVRLQPINPAQSGVLKTVQNNHPPTSVVRANHVAPKPTAGIGNPICPQPVVVATQNATAHSHTSASGAFSAVLANEGHSERRLPNLDTSAPNETFDISQLKSDSDSDGEQPNRKIPRWCRHGNQNLMDTLCLIRSGQLKWPKEFTMSSQITFDLNEIFQGYNFHRKPRTSSGIWNTPNGPRAQDH